MMRSWRLLASSALCALVAPVVGVVAFGPTTAGADVAHALTVSSSNIGFEDTTLGDFTIEQYTVTNNNSSDADVLSDFNATGANPNDFAESPDLSGDCPVDTSTGNVDLAPMGSDGDSCVFDVFFFPGALGGRSATLTLVDTLDTNTSVHVSGNGTIGYYQTDTDGDVANFGDAVFYGDLSQDNLNQPIEGIAQTGDDGGYWLVARDGGVFPFGDAQFSGSMGGHALNKPITGIAPDLSQGTSAYWLVATDGGIFSFGGAPFFGSTGAIALNKPIVGMAATNSGGGYWLVASDGGIFAYGDAQFYGSTGSIHLNQPIVGMAPTPDDGGYWLVAADGGIFAYGDAQFYGSTGALHLVQPITAMAAMPDGNGYWFTANDGGLFNYGTAPFYGAGNSVGLGDVVGMATDGAPTPQAATHTPAARHAHESGGGAWSSPPSGDKVQASS